MRTLQRWTLFSHKRYALTGREKKGEAKSQENARGGPSHENAKERAGSVYSGQLTGSSASGSTSSEDGSSWTVQRSKTSSGSSETNRDGSRMTSTP